MGRKISAFVACLAGVMLLIVPGAMAAIQVNSISPTFGDVGTTVQCTVTGTFHTPVPLPTFQLVNGATTIVGTTTSASVTWASVSFVLPADAPAVWYELKANQSPDTASLPHAFQVVPTISSLSPSSVVAGAGDLTLTVNGGGFANWNLPYQGSSVLWNGAAVATTYKSPTQLTAVIPAARLTTPGTVEVTVTNVTAGTSSASRTFTITALAPFLSSLTPTQVWAGYVKNDVVLTVTGGNFLTGAHIFLSGGEKTGTTFVSAAQLTVPLLATDISTPTTLTVSVKNPPLPPGTSSLGALLLPVAAETTDPTVTISGADTAWHNSPVALTFSATDGQSGVQKLQYQAPPVVATWTDGTAYTVPVTTQGAIAVSAQALDWCNRVGTASATVNIDTTQPGTAALGDVSVKKGKTAKLKYRITEPAGLSPSAKVVIKIKRSDGSTAKTTTINSAPTNVQQSYSFTCNLAKGSYKWYVYATDLAGNTQENVAKASLKVK